MPLHRLDFDVISEADLAELVNAKVPEDHRIEYKRDIYRQGYKDKKELLKDASAFANVNGGHIIIGMDEADSVAAELCGIGSSSDIGADENTGLWKNN